jgi:hypothetical protein
MLRRSRWVGSLALLALVSACTTQASPSVNKKPAVGFITGVASPCIGPARPGFIDAKIKVRVQLSGDQRLVATQTVTGSHVYRLAAPPGTYMVSSDQGGTTPQFVTVSKGKTRRADLNSACR